jgi:hypothetical protein
MSDAEGYTGQIGVEDHLKWRRSLLKKLRGIENLKLKAARGDPLAPAQQVPVGHWRLLPFSATSCCPPLSPISSHLPCV